MALGELKEALSAEARAALSAQAQAALDAPGDDAPGDDAPELEITAEARRVTEAARDAQSMADRLDSLVAELATVKDERAALARKLAEAEAGGPSTQEAESNEAKRAASLAADLAASRAAERVARSRLDEMRSATEAAAAEQAEETERLRAALAAAEAKKAAAESEVEARPSKAQWDAVQAQLAAMALVAGVEDASAADEHGELDSVSMLRSKAAGLEAELIAQRVEASRLAERVSSLAAENAQRGEELGQQRALIAALEGEGEGGAAVAPTGEVDGASMAATLARQRNAYRERVRALEGALENAGSKVARLEADHQKHVAVLRQRDLELRRLLSERAGRDAMQLASEVDLEGAARGAKRAGRFASMHDRAAVAVAKGLLSSGSLRTFAAGYLACLHTLVFLVLAWVGHRGSHHHHLSAAELARECGRQVGLRGLL